MLVNTGMPPELLGMVERPLDRHHMFAAPVAEPLPVGASPQDIEKCTEKMNFIKDVEVGVFSSSRGFPPYAASVTTFRSVLVAVTLAPKRV